jgi:hypothetical protein
MKKSSWSDSEPSVQYWRFGGSGSMACSGAILLSASAMSISFPWLVCELILSCGGGILSTHKKHNG